MKTKKLLLIATLLITPSISNAEECHIPSEQLKSGNIGQCKNKTVKIIVTPPGFVSQDSNDNNDGPDMVMQHPMGMHDRLDLATKKVIRQKENYVNFDGMQIVATSKEYFNCSGKIELEGKVNIVDLGGKAGKSSYRNMWIRTHNHKCID